MKLADKGRFQPPPRLTPKAAQALAEVLTGWPQVQARTHWQLGDETRVDGADFYVGEHELGHLHLDGDAHVAVGRLVRDALVKRGLAHAFPWSRDFVTWQVESEATRAHAEWLFSLRHAVLRGQGVDEVLRLVSEHPVGA